MRPGAPTHSNTTAEPLELVFGTDFAKDVEHRLIRGIDQHVRAEAVARHSRRSAWKSDTMIG